MSKFETLSFDIPGILRTQKNRYPMLFIDRVSECVPMEYATAHKVFSANEWYFHGYESLDLKVWNAVQVEAMAQTFLMTFLSDEQYAGREAMSHQYDNVQFMRKIEPGERLDMKATLSFFKRGIAKGSVVGTVRGQRACSMNCTITVPSLFLRPKADLGSGEAINSTHAFMPQKEEGDFGFRELQAFLCNKYPWLLLDFAKRLIPGESLLGYKCFTYNEHYFPVHFDGDPSVPGFIQIESGMQAFLLSFLSIEGFHKKETADRSLTNVCIRRKIVPGEILELDVKLLSFKRGVAKGVVVGSVGDEPAISFEATAVVIDEFEKWRPRIS